MGLRDVFRTPPSRGLHDEAAFLCLTVWAALRCQRKLTLDPNSEFKTVSSVPAPRQCRTGAQQPNQSQPSAGTAPAAAVAMVATCSNGSHQEHCMMYRTTRQGRFAPAPRCCGLTQSRAEELHWIFGWYLGCLASRKFALRVFGFRSS